MGNFESEARLIASRNLTANVGGVGASLDEEGHLQVTYYLFGSATEEDEDERELTVGELIAAFPQVLSASSYSGFVDEIPNDKSALAYFRP